MIRTILLFGSFIASLCWLSNYYHELALPQALAVVTLTSLALGILLPKDKRIYFHIPHTPEIQDGPKTIGDERTQPTDQLSDFEVRAEVIRSSGFIAAAMIKYILERKLYLKFPLIDVASRSHCEFRCNCTKPCDQPKNRKIRGLIIAGGERGHLGSEPVVILRNPHSFEL